MPVCEVCQNDYHNTIEIRIDGKSHTFDCFECAINALAPECAHCACRVIGHGVEESGRVYCCEHCLRHGKDTAKSGAGKVVDINKTKQEKRAETRWENEGGSPVTT